MNEGRGCGWNEYCRHGVTASIDQPPRPAWSPGGRRADSAQQPAPSQSFSASHTGSYILEPIDVFFSIDFEPNQTESERQSTLTISPFIHCEPACQSPMNYFIAVDGSFKSLRSDSVSRNVPSNNRHR